MKLILYIYIFLNIYLLYSLADTYEERKFIIEAKLGVLPGIEIIEISTELKTQDGFFDYIFDIRSLNIIKFINEINGKGRTKGKILDDEYIPSKYTYTYNRKEKSKYVEIIYEDNFIKKLVVTPEYDESNLTPLTNKMLEKTIDPPTFFLSILDYKNMNNCQKIFRIFDGKRRYDVEFNKSSKSSDDLIECEAKQIKLGGYKKNENDVFATSDFIKILYENNKHNKFLRYEAKNGKINILIEEANIK